MAIISISLPETQVASITQLAKEQNRSRSQVIKDALSAYEFDCAWRELRKWGDSKAKELGIETDDDVELLFG